MAGGRGAAQVVWPEDGGTAALAMKVEDTLAPVRALLAELKAAGGTVAQTDLKARTAVLQALPTAVAACDSDVAAAPQASPRQCQRLRPECAAHLVPCSCYSVYLYCFQVLQSILLIICITRAVMMVNARTSRLTT